MTEDRIRRAVGLMAQIDEIVAITPADELDSRLMALKPQIDQANESTVCEKDELDIPMHGMPVRPLEIPRIVLQEGWSAVKRRISSLWRREHPNGRHAPVEEDVPVRPNWGDEG